MACHSAAAISVPCAPLLQTERQSRTEREGLHYAVFDCFTVMPCVLQKEELRPRNWACFALAWFGAINDEAKSPPHDDHVHGAGMEICVA